MKSVRDLGLATEKSKARLAARMSKWNRKGMCVCAKKHPQKYAKNLHSSGPALWRLSAKAWRSAYCDSQQRAVESKGGTLKGLETVRDQ